MPLPMTHLSIADRLITGLQIKDEPQFYLGVNSPDAIHMRPNADRAAKKMTHLTPEGSRYADRFETDDKEYMNFLADFIAVNKPNTNSDFLMGYVVHILTDVLWNILVGSNA